MKRSTLAIALSLFCLLPGAWSSVAEAAETASVSGNVYCDKDQDGVCGCEENGLKGIHIQIFDQHCGGTALQTVSTDEQGNFAFVGFAPGSYFVRVDLRYVCGGRVPTTGNCRQIQLTAGETVELPAFGLSEYGQ